MIMRSMVFDAYRTRRVVGSVNVVEIIAIVVEIIYAIYCCNIFFSLIFESELFLN